MKDPYTNHSFQIGGEDEDLMKSINPNFENATDIEADIKNNMVSKSDIANGKIEKVPLAMKLLNNELFMSRYKQYRNVRRISKNKPIKSYTPSSTGKGVTAKKIKKVMKYRKKVMKINKIVGGMKPGERDLFNSVTDYGKDLFGIVEAFANTNARRRKIDPQDASLYPGITAIFHAITSYTPATWIKKVPISEREEIIRSYRDNYEKLKDTMDRAALENFGENYMRSPPETTTTTTTTQPAPPPPSSQPSSSQEKKKKMVVKKKPQPAPPPPTQTAEIETQTEEPPIAEGTLKIGQYVENAKVLENRIRKKELELQEAQRKLLQYEDAMRRAALPQTITSDYVNPSIPPRSSSIPLYEEARNKRELKLKQPLTPVPMPSTTREEEEALRRIRATKLRFPGILPEKEPEITIPPTAATTMTTLEGSYFPRPPPPQRDVETGVPTPSPDKENLEYGVRSPLPFDEEATDSSPYETDQPRAIPHEPDVPAFLESERQPTLDRISEFREGGPRTVVREGRTFPLAAVLSSLAAMLGATVPLYNIATDAADIYSRRRQLPKQDAEESDSSESQEEPKTLSLPSIRTIPPEVMQRLSRAVYAPEGAGGSTTMSGYGFWTSISSAAISYLEKLLSNLSPMLLKSIKKTFAKFIINTLGIPKSSLPSLEESDLKSLLKYLNEKKFTPEQPSSQPSSQPPSLPETQPISATGVLTPITYGRVVCPILRNALVYGGMRRSMVNKLIVTLLDKMPSNSLLDNPIIDKTSSAAGFASSFYSNPVIVNIRLILSKIIEQLDILISSYSTTRSGKPRTKVNTRLINSMKKTRKIINRSISSLSPKSTSSLTNNTSGMQDVDQSISSASGGMMIPRPGTNYDLGSRTFRVSPEYAQNQMLEKINRPFPPTTFYSTYQPPLIPVTTPSTPPKRTKKQKKKVKKIVKKYLKKRGVISSSPSAKGVVDPRKFYSLLLLQKKKYKKAKKLYRRSKPSASGGEMQQHADSLHLDPSGYGVIKSRYKKHKLIRSRMKKMSSSIPLPSGYGVEQSIPNPYTPSESISDSFLQSSDYSNGGMVRRRPPPYNPRSSSQQSFYDYPNF